MKVSSFLRFLEDQCGNNRVFLLYGNNHSLIELRIEFLRRFLSRSPLSPLGVRSLENLDTLAEIEAPSLFGTLPGGEKRKTFYRFSSTSIKAFEQLGSLQTSFPGYLVWEAGALSSKSPLIQAAEKSPQVSVIPVWDPEKNEIAFYIRHFLESEAISCEPEALEYLVRIHQDEPGALRSNMDILVLYALKTQKITLQDVRIICQDFMSEDLKRCVLAFFAGNKKKFLQEFHNLGAPSVGLIPFVRFAGKMLQNKLEGGYSPFSRSSAHELSRETMVVMIREFLELERAIKIGKKVTDIQIVQKLLKICPFSK